MSERTKPILVAAVIAWLGWGSGFLSARAVYREHPTRVTVFPCAVSAEQLDAMVRERMQPIDLCAAMVRTADAMACDTARKEATR